MKAQNKSRTSSIKPQQDIDVIQNNQAIRRITMLQTCARNYQLKSDNCLVIRMKLGSEFQ